MQEEESLYVVVSPRNERRLLREKSAKRSIGRTIGSLSSGAKKLVDAPFDPRAEDGDGDGKVQDNTRWERPGTPSLPNAENVDYRGQHSPPTKEDGAPLHDLTKVYPEDIYSPEGRNYYATGEERIDSQAFELINKLKGKPNAMVTVYRAVPISREKRIEEIEKQRRYILKHRAIPPNVRTPISDVSEYYESIADELDSIKDRSDNEIFSILPGDWVTPFRSYAVEHGQSNLGGQGKYEVVKRKVRAGDIYTAGDSWAEWGYNPQDDKIETGLSSGAGRGGGGTFNSPKIYTMLDYVNERILRGHETTDDENISAEAIDNLAEHVISRILAGKINPIVEEVEIYDALGIALDLNPEKRSIELNLKEAIKRFNNEFGTNISAESIILGVADSLSGEIDLADIKKILENIDGKELVKIHESSDYSYGDLNLLTGEKIVATDPRWLRGMTPRQIAKLTCPENSDLFLLAMIDYAFAEDIQERMDEIEKAVQSGVQVDQKYLDILDEYKKVVNALSSLIQIDEFNEEKVEQLRSFMERALESSPAFLSAVHAVGMPMVAAFDKPYTFIDPSMSGKIFGFYGIPTNTISINSKLIQGFVDSDSWEDEYRITDLFDKRKYRMQTIIDPVVDTLVHEWGHYLWSILTRGLVGVNLGAGTILSPKSSPSPLTYYSRLMMNGLTKSEAEKLIYYLKLFDLGTSEEITSKSNNGGGFFDAAVKISARSDEELIARRKTHRLSIVYSRKIQNAVSSGDIQLANELIEQVANSPEIFATTEYGATDNQEAFAEIIKDFLSPVGSGSRIDALSQGAFDAMDEIFGMIKKLIEE